MAWNFDDYIPEEFTDDFKVNQVSTYGRRLFTIEKFFGFQKKAMTLSHLHAVQPKTYRQAMILYTLKKSGGLN